MEKSSQRLEKSSQCLDEAVQHPAIFGEARSELAALPDEYSQRLFEHESGMSEAREELSESFGTTKVSFDGRRSSFAALGRGLGRLGAAAARRFRAQSSLGELLQAL